MTDFPTFEARARKKKPRFNVGWLVLGGLVVGVWTAGFSLAQRFVSVAGTSNVPLDLLRGVGIGIAGGLAGAVVVGLLVHLLAGGRHDPGKAGLRFAVLAGVAIFVAIPLSGFRVMGEAFHKEEVALQEIRLDAEDRVEALKGRLHDQRESIVAGGFMENEALAQPGGVARARRKLVQLRAMASRVEGESELIAAQARAQIAKVPVSEPRRRLMLEEFDRGFAKAKVEEAKDVELANLMFDEMDAQLDILSRTPRAWALQQGRLGFARQRDLDDFRARVLRLEDIGQVMDERERERETRRRAERDGRRIVSSQP